MSADAIAAASVWKYFGDYPALRGATLAAPAGACVALLGRNGAGKTTLLRILANLSRPSKGEVTVFGESAHDEKVRARIGYLGHGIGVYDDLTAFENLTLFGQLMNVQDTKSAAESALEQVGLTRVRDGYAREFSRGMRQRLAIARAFLHQPEILLLDEPFTSLDDRAIAVLHDLLRSALSKGATIVMSTHQIREAMELATQVALLERGKIVHAGPRTPEMLADPGWLYRTYEKRPRVKQGLLSAWFIARKDLRTEFRTKEALNASVSFALVVLMLFSFAFDLGREEFYDISGGLLWLVYVFAGALIVNRSFVREVPNDCLDVLIASPMPAWSLFLGKTISSFVLLMIVELVSLPVYGLFNNLQWTHAFWPLLGTMMLATWGITVTGVAFSAVTVNVRLRELMLPVLHYPLLVPLLIGAMQISTALIKGEATDVGLEMRIIVVFDTVFTSLALYLIEFILVG